MQAHREKVLKALESPDWDWRTLQGIVTDTGLTEDQVRYELKLMVDLLVTTESKSHGTLYTLKTKIADRLSQTQLSAGSISGIELT